MPAYACTLCSALAPSLVADVEREEDFERDEFVGEGEEEVACFVEEHVGAGHVEGLLC